MGFSVILKILPEQTPSARETFFQRHPDYGEK